MNKLLNRLFVAIYSIPWLKEQWARSYQSLEFNTIPWTPLKKPLNQCKFALLTTGGVHLKKDIPFDMEDTNGDPTYRIIPSITKFHELMTTHDYYDHRDADRDINLVFPIEVLHTCLQEDLQ